MPRIPSARRPTSSVRRRPALTTSSAVVLLMTGCAVVGGFDASAQSRPESGPRVGALGTLSLPGAAPAPASGVVPLLPTLFAGASPVPSPSPSPQASRSTTRAVVPTNRDALLSAKLRDAMAATSASLSVAVVDLDDTSRARYGVRAGRTYDTASIVKVDILAALLLKAQDEHRGLTAAEKAYASSMIRVSDNAATDALWGMIGGAGGLDAANRRLGLKGTTAGAGGLWGLTQTTAPDQLILLSAVFGEKSPLTASSRSYARTLMGRIADGQDWGVSAAGRAVGLKNGWLPRSATGLWDVNSIGEVTVGGHTYLLAVVSKGSVSMASGISLVERAAKAAVSALATTSA
ncbi:serine hydrolase [Streptomyces sp. NPDC006638]|uniref:serine hydrolase n=1 Tax=Streptomyces sp. NPDC006638 TaxID=3157183 RepID=UPI0033A3B9D6